jgi:hypothetical protein
MSRLPHVAFLFAVLLAPPARRRGDGRVDPLESVGRGDIAPLPFFLSTGPLLASAAHAAAGRGFVGGFGGDLGDVPELPETRTVGVGPDAVPAVISQFEDHQGVVAVGMVEELLVELNKAFCDQGLTRVYKCADFEDARKRLWMTFADTHVCGGLDDEKWSTPPRAVMDLPVQEQFEYLLSQCSETWRGDLVNVVRDATVLFLAQSTLNRPDIKATVVANDAKAQRNDTLPTDDLYELHPGFYEALAPASTGKREPAVATWLSSPTWTATRRTPRGASRVKRRWTRAPGFYSRKKAPRSSTRLCSTPTWTPRTRGRARTARRTEATRARKRGGTKSRFAPTPFPQTTRRWWSRASRASCPFWA